MWKFQNTAVCAPMLLEHLSDPAGIQNGTVREFSWAQLSVYQCPINMHDFFLFLSAFLMVVGLINTVDVHPVLRRCPALHAVVVTAAITPQSSVVQAVK